MSKKIPKLTAGFSMLEMLIALLILSIGLLGVATLQIRGQQFNQIGYLRTQATFLAYDIMDRIRINQNAAKDCDYAPNSMPTALTTDCDNIAAADMTGCSHDDLVTYDLVKWNALVAETLPLLAGKQPTIVGIDDDNNNVCEGYTITIQWANIIDRKDTNHEEQKWELQL